MLSPPWPSQDSHLQSLVEQSRAHFNDLPCPLTRASLENWRSEALFRLSTSQPSVYEPACEWLSDIFNLDVNFINPEEVLHAVVEMHSLRWLQVEEDLAQFMAAFRGCIHKALVSSLLHIFRTKFSLPTSLLVTLLPN